MALDVLAAAGITALGNYFGGLNAAGPEGSYVAPSDARFAYLNMQKFNPDSGAISALQQSKTRLSQMKAQRLGYIQQQYNQQRAAGGIGGHQLAGSLGLMGNQFAAMAEQELALDKAIADQTDRTNQQRLQKYAAQQQAILTPSKDGNQKFGTLGQKLTDAFNAEGERVQWDNLEDVIQWINSNYGDPSGTNTGLGGDNDDGNNDVGDWAQHDYDGQYDQETLNAYQLWKTYSGGNLSIDDWYNQIYKSGSGAGPTGGTGGAPPGIAPEILSAWQAYLTEHPEANNAVAYENWYQNIYQSGGGDQSGGSDAPDVLNPNPINDGMTNDGYFVKDPTDPTGGKGTVAPVGAAPIISAQDLMAPVNSQGKPIVDPMVFPKYNQPKQKLNLPIDDNLLAMYKQGLLEM